MKNIFIVGCVCAGLCAVSGCGSSHNPAFEQFSKREFYSRQRNRVPGEFSLRPKTRTVLKEDIKITVTHMTHAELDKFFLDSEFFGTRAHNPYPDDSIVFDVKIANFSDEPIRIYPEQCIIVDDLHGQHQNLAAYYRPQPKGWSKPVSGFTQAGEDYAPGYYDAPFKIANYFFQRKTNRIDAMLEKVMLRSGYIYPNVKYEGHVFFPESDFRIEEIKLIFPNVQTKFDYDNRAVKAVQFVFPFKVSYGDESIPVAENAPPKEMPPQAASLDHHFLEKPVLPSLTPSAGDSGSSAPAGPPVTTSSAPAK
ncbi:MAG: hypothetical protein GF333_01200 [Candidatus Omnitrophica bacterium]|nr:hypothetical protein [Candidatus Omnitrophota bacterium]